MEGNGSTFRCTPASKACPGPDSGDGLSLSGDDCSSRSHHCRVNVPDLPLRFHAGLRRSPFGSPFHPHGRFRPVGFIAVNPLLRSTQRFQLRLGFHSPSGPSSPSGSKRSADLSLKSPPSGSARLPFAPRNASINSGSSDHRSRLATAPEARCSKSEAKRS